MTEKSFIDETLLLVVCGTADREIPLTDTITEGYCTAFVWFWPRQRRNIFILYGLTAGKQIVRRRVLDLFAREPRIRCNHERFNNSNIHRRDD